MPRGFVATRDPIAPGLAASAAPLALSGGRSGFFEITAPTTTERIMATIRLNARLPIQPGDKNRTIREHDFRPILIDPATIVRVRGRAYATTIIETERHGIREKYLTPTAANQVRSAVALAMRY